MKGYGRNNSVPTQLMNRGNKPPVNFSPAKPKVKKEKKEKKPEPDSKFRKRME
jgi:hypothetical protein